MKNFLFFFIIISIFSSISIYSQNKDEKEKAEAVAAQYLNSAANEAKVPSNIISTESLDKVKADYLSMALKYDSTGESNSMMLLPANKIKTMTPAEVWDYMENLSSTMGKSKMDIKWNIVNTEIKNDLAIVTYDVKGRKQKILYLRKENNKWKVILSFASIF